MRAYLRRLAPWLPWPFLAAAAAVDAANIGPEVPNLLQLVVVALVATYTIAGVLCRRLTAATERAAVTEALARGYELASEHCIRHDTPPAEMPVAVGETTTGGIRRLRVIRPDFTVPRARGRHQRDR